MYADTSHEHQGEHTPNDTRTPAATSPELREQFAFPVPTRPDHTRTTSKSPSTPTSRNVERDPEPVAMDGSCHNPRPHAHTWNPELSAWICPLVLVPIDVKPIDPDQPERPVGSLARRLLTERGPSGPVGFVAACPPPEVLVDACARAEYERFRAVLVSRSPFGRLIPSWDDELGWARSTFARQARVDAMRERLTVLWPVIVEHLGWA